MRLAWDFPVLRTLTQSMYLLVKCLTHCRGNIASEPIEMVRIDSGGPHRGAGEAENRCDVHLALGPSLLWVLIVSLFQKTVASKFAKKEAGCSRAESRCLARFYIVTA